MRTLHGVYDGVSSSLLGPVDPSFRARSGRLKFTVRRHKFNDDSFFSVRRGAEVAWEKSPTGVQGYLAHKVRGF